MSAHCSQPDLQMVLLDETREGAALLPDHARHLEECAACQTSVERLRRMTSVWNADPVDEAAFAAAAARFHARNGVVPRTPGWGGVLLYATVGVVAGLLFLVVTGTVALPGKSAGSRPREEALYVAPVYATTEDAAKLVRARPHIETSRGLAPLIDGLRLKLKRGEAALIVMAGGRTSRVEGPCMVEFRSAPMEVSGWSFVREEDPSASNEVKRPDETNGASAPSAALGSSNSSIEPSRPNEMLVAGTSLAGKPAPSDARELAPSARATGAAAALSETVAGEEHASTGQGGNPVSARAWARAAAALRQDDFEGADRAFDELGHSADPATRDAARLARAQLWISRGREATVRPVLEQLAENGATPLVRQRAAELLRRDAR